MPSSCNRRRVCFVWHFRAVAFRRCVRASSATVRSISFADGRCSSHQYGINTPSAVCTWHSVSSGFSPPEFLPHPRQEQVADGTQSQMAFQPHILATLVVIQADFALLVLEATLDATVIMPPKVEVGWPDRPATGPR